MVMDGAVWHGSNQLRAPENIYLLKLPPYAPELNPMEHVWDELHEESFHNRAFDSPDALEEHLAVALKAMENNPAKLSAIVSWPWIIRSPLTSFMN